MILLLLLVIIFICTLKKKDYTYLWRITISMHECIHLSHEPPYLIIDKMTEKTKLAL